MNYKEIPESIRNSLLEILKQIEDEDRYVREKMIRECKQFDLYWHGFQYLFWDEGIGDWRVPTHDVLEEVSTREEHKYIYDYVVNTFKAHGLSIVAALASEVPNVPFSPCDASNPRDITAAEKAEELGKILQKKNKSKLLFYHALFTLYTNHFVACYNYFERDKKYGSVDIPKFSESTETTPDSFSCNDAGCGFTGPNELDTCPMCSGPMTKIPGKEESVLNQVGVETVDKGMERYVVKGTLNIKIPVYAADQEACGYLIDYSDQHFAWLRKNYPEVPRDKINPSQNEDLERITRMQSVGRLYSDSYTMSLVTFKRAWIRDWMIDSLDEARAVELRKAFGEEGIYFSVIDKDTIAEAESEDLDAHWTIGKGDLSRAAHADPLGKPLLPMQDLENTVMNLLVETLEHSVPSTFADPEIVNFEEYSKQPVEPGLVYPAKNSLTPNRRMDDFFFTLKTSALSKEAVDFNEIVESKGQFLVGAFPSIFGGPQTEGSKTLGEYQESRSYALQRLSIPYQLLYFWWADITHKGVLDYIENMVADEKHTVQIQDGKYESIEFLIEDFKHGRFDSLISESSPDLPTSFSQKRATLQSVIQLNSDYLNQFLFSPENRRVTLRYLGMEELSDLDSNQTMKQLYEIDELLKTEPTMGQMGEQLSSIPIEPEIDEPEIHLRILKTFLSGRRGQWNKKNNPAGYLNCLLHAREHQMAMLEMQAAQAEMGAGAEEGKEETPKQEESEEEQYEA